MNKGITILITLFSITAFAQDYHRYDLSISDINVTRVSTGVLNDTSNIRIDNFNADITGSIVYKLKFISGTYIPVNQVISNQGRLALSTRSSHTDNVSAKAFLNITQDFRSELANSASLNLEIRCPRDLNLTPGGNPFLLLYGGSPTNDCVVYSASVR
jgi:hypothetical protein